MLYDGRVAYSAQSPVQEGLLYSVLDETILALNLLMFELPAMHALLSQHPDLQDGRIPFCSLHGIQWGEPHFFHNTMQGLRCGMQNRCHLHHYGQLPCAYWQIFSCSL